MGDTPLTATGWEALAPGKVNVCLFVGAPRADGMHPLVSVVQPVTLADTVRLELCPGAGEDAVHCPGVSGENLAARALARYREATGWSGPPVRIEIVKRVPVAAGMGGGSGDAAATLRLVAAAAGRPRDPILDEIAPALGADVPSQLEPRRTLMTGAGERVAPLETPEREAILIVPSAHGLSTPAVYAELDRLGAGRPPAQLGAIEAAVRHATAVDGALPPELVFNDLEQAARSLLPEIERTLADVRATGADHALVSGSGPTVLGLFQGADGAARAQAAAGALRERHPGAVAVGPASPAFSAPRPVAA